MREDVCRPVIFFQLARTNDCLVLKEPRRNRKLNALGKIHGPRCIFSNQNGVFGEKNPVTAHCSERASTSSATVDGIPQGGSRSPLRGRRVRKGAPCQGHADTSRGSRHGATPICSRPIVGWQIDLCTLLTRRYLVPPTHHLPYFPSTSTAPSPSGTSRLQPIPIPSKTIIHRSVSTDMIEATLRSAFPCIFRSAPKWERQKCPASPTCRACVRPGP